MPAQTRPELEAKIAQCPQLRLDELTAGFPQLHIRNTFGSARVSLYGAQVLSYQPTHSCELLWMSPTAKYQAGRSIRGGIPLCWPWFGPHPDDPSKPAHGFARHHLWQLDHIESDEHATRLELSLPVPEGADQAALSLSIGVGKTLQLALRSDNTGKYPLQISAALHSYFAISDIGDIHIEGLDDTLFRDAVNDDRICKQCGPIRFHGELDRVYHDTEGDILIHDPARKHAIRIHKGGSRSTVVWNPWVDKAARLGDIPADGYRQMVCVESANADHNRIALLPGESHCLYTEISSEASV